MNDNTRLERARLQCESLLRSSDGVTNRELHRESNMLDDNYKANVGNMEYLPDKGNISGPYRGHYDIHGNSCIKDAGSRAAHHKNAHVPKSVNTPSVRDDDFTSPTHSAENVSVDSLNMGRYVSNDQIRSHRPRVTGQSSTRMMNLSKSTRPDHDSNNEFCGGITTADAFLSKNYENDSKDQKVMNSQDDSSTSATHRSNADNSYNKDGRNNHGVSNDNDQKVGFNEVRKQDTYDSTILGEKEKDSIIIALQVTHHTSVS